MYVSLFELLAPRDLVVLLSSCQALRSDVGLAVHALQTNAVTRHFGQCCPCNWFATTPQYDHQFVCNERSHVPQSWDAVGTLRPRSLVALLSLVGLMTTQLKSVLYSDLEGYGDRWQVVPLIIPTQMEGEGTPSELCRVVEASMPGLGTAFASAEPFLSQPGLHWENLEVQADTGDVSCAFCEMVDREVVQFLATARAYWEHQYDALAQVEDECRNAGYGSDTDEFAIEVEAREEAFMEQMRVTDAFYDESLLDEELTIVVQSLLRRGRLPLLRLMEPMTSAVENEVMQAAAEGYRTQLCPQVYRPLRKFFSTNGFQYVRRLQASPYTDYEKYELGRGEMVGGLTPHGFFAGVYLVEYFV